MKTLIVSATALEVAPALKAFGCSVSSTERISAGYSHTHGELSFLVSGVGQMLCGVHLSEHLDTHHYDLVIQAGIAGAFSDSLPRRTVVQVGSEALADLGAEDNGSFLDIHSMGLLDGTVHPFTEGRLVAPSVPLQKLIGLPRVSSVTVNRVLSEARSIAWVHERFSPAVVNMEGAALFYVLLRRGIPFVSLRSISDVVGPRDAASWDIPGSIATLNETLAAVIGEALVADPIRDGRAR